MIEMSPQDAATTILPSPKSYAQKVFNYSRCDVGDCYFTGVHYSRLGNFLNSPYQHFGDGVAVPLEQTDFPFVTLCDLSTKENDPHRTRQFSRPEEFTKFLSAMAFKAQGEDIGVDRSLSRVGTSTSAAIGSQAQSSQHSHHKTRHTGVVVFLRGFGSARWLNHLGAALDVDPELFYRHQAVAFKDMPPALQLEDSYSTPFPQTSDLIQLRACNTGSLSANRHELSLATLREACEASMKCHVEDFVRLRNFAVGDSIVRRFTLHDLHNFSIEQRISVEVIYRTNTWSILVWLDAGNDLSQCNNGPWLQKFPNTENAKFHPVFQHRSRMALSPVSKSTSGESAGPHPQSINHLSQNFGRHLKPEIMAQDAFYALNELFEFSAASVDQLLELCESNIKDMSHDSVATRLSELLNLKTFVDDYRSYTKDTLSTVQARGGRNWPSAIQGTAQRDKANRAAIQLENRYRRLLERCERLQEHCASSATILMNQQAQQQTDRVMEQTKQLNKLSILAYFYIPVTFTASFFGMNFKELGTELSIWNFFVMSASLVIVSIVAWVIDLRAVYQLGTKLVLMLRLPSWRKRKSP